MDPNWETYLRHQLPSVVQVLRPKMLADRLYADRLLNKTEYEDLTHSADSQENKARRMLLMLQRRGPGSFDQFCDVLQQVDGQKFIEEMLRPYIDRSRDSVLSEPARPSPAVVEREDRHEEDEQVASPAESMHESITGSAGHLAIVVEGSVSAEVNKQIMETVQHVAEYEGKKYDTKLKAVSKRGSAGTVAVVYRSAKEDSHTQQTSSNSSLGSNDSENIASRVVSNQLGCQEFGNGSEMSSGSVNYCKPFQASSDGQSLDFRHMFSSRSLYRGPGATESLGSECMAVGGNIQDQRLQLNPEQVTGQLHSPCQTKVTKQLITVVAHIGRVLWRQLGEALGFSSADLDQYMGYKDEDRARRVVTDWIAKEGLMATKDHLMRACEKIGIDVAVEVELEAEQHQN